jgi:hypothetical protein
LTHFPELFIATPSLGGRGTRPRAALRGRSAAKQETTHEDNALVGFGSIPGGNDRYRLLLVVRTQLPAQCPGEQLLPAAVPTGMLPNSRQLSVRWWLDKSDRSPVRVLQSLLLGKVRAGRIDLG